VAARQAAGLISQCDTQIDDLKREVARYTKAGQRGDTIKPSGIFSSDRRKVGDWE
jgi:hypothetical protein